MTRKNTRIRPVDLATPVRGGGAGVPPAAASVAPQQPRPRVAAPFGLAVVEVGTEREGPSVTGWALLSWFPGAGTPASAGWEVQWSRAADYSITPITKGTTRPGEIDRLEIGTTYYARVRAVVAGRPTDWSESIEVLVAPGDTTPPDAPENLSIAWSGVSGDAVISVDISAATNVRAVRFKVYTEDGGTLLRTFEGGAAFVVWTLDMQRTDRTTYAPATLALPALATFYVEATHLGWGGAESAEVSATATLAAPAQPAAFTTSWDGDDGTADEDLTVFYGTLPTVPLYELTFDLVGTTGALPALVRNPYAGIAALTVSHIYTYAKNVEQHYGYQALDVSLVAVDVYGQRSTPRVALEVTNAPPPAPLSVDVTPAVVDVVTIRIQAIEPLDFRAYLILPYKDGVVVSGGGFTTTATIVSYKVQDGDGSYQFEVGVQDMFYQLTNAPLTDPVVVDPLTLEEIREGITYSDSLGTDPDTLKAQLADDDRDSGGQAYGAGSAWAWTEIDWQIPERVGNVTIVTSAALAEGYIGISMDGTTYRFYSGPLTGSTLTYIGAGALGSAAEVSARAVAVILPLVASSQYLRLPDVQEARYIRLGHRNTGAGYTLYEFYARRKVVGDDIIGEIITGITINGSVINGGQINGGVITGAVIQTAETGERVVLDADGLKTYDSLGNIVIEATTDTDGALLAGVGKVRLDRSGLAAIVGSTLDSVAAYNFKTAGGALGAQMIAAVNTSLSDTYLTSTGIAASSNSSLTLQSDAGAGGVATLNIDALEDSVLRARIGMTGLGGTGLILLQADSLGFFDSIGTSKPTITGSRGGNAALADLLSSLAAMGLITDSSSA